MSKLWMKWFGGMRPRMGDQNLKGTQKIEQTGLFHSPQVQPNFELSAGVHATEAENCNLYSGELRPLHKPALAHRFCKPGDDCFNAPLPDDPSVPPEPPPEPPLCVPVVIVAPVLEPPIPETVWATGPNGDSWVGYGHQRMLISDGVVNGKFILDVVGYGPAKFSPDKGDTWEDASWNTDSSGRLYHGSTQYATDKFILMGYRSDNKDHRFWTNEYTGPGSLDKNIGNTWAYLGGNALSYCHGYAINGTAGVWSCDGNNNSESTMMEMKYYDPDDGTPLSITRGAYSLDRTTTTSHWHTYKIGSRIVYIYSGQGSKVGGYGWTGVDSLDNPGAPAWDGTPWDWRQFDTAGVIFDGITSASSGGSIYSTGSVSDVIDTQTCIVNNSVKIQQVSVDANLPLSFNTMSFPEDVDHAFVHYENNRYIVTARSLADRTKIYFGYGVSGTVKDAYYITIPYEENYPYRDLRYVGGGDYILACVCQVGSTAQSVVAVRVNLTAFEAGEPIWVET